MLRTVSRSMFVAVATAVALLSSVLTAVPASAAGVYVEGTDRAAPLFDPMKIVDVDLQIPEASLDALKTQTMCGTLPYQDATLTLTTDTATYGPMEVGVRFKGCYGSWREWDQKPGWKIKINKVSGQNILGLKKLTLNNMVQDGTQIHEALAYRLFRAMGVAASRVGYASVTMNGLDYGTYLNIETLDSVSLARWYGANNTLHLYEGAYGQDPTNGREWEFEIDEGATDNIDDLIALSAANELTGTAWWTAIQQRANMNQMTSEWATEYYLRHWDGYITRNNYYLHSTLDGKFTMLPWGSDQTFADSGWDEVINSPDGIMQQRCMTVKPCLDLYAANVVKVKNLANSLRLDTMATAVGEVVDSWGISETKSWITERRSSVGAWIADNTVERPTATIRRSGAQTIQSWTAPNSHGLTITKYQVGVKRAGVWKYYTTTARTFTFAHPRRTTMLFRVRALTALGYGEWSTSLSGRRN